MSYDISKLTSSTPLNSILSNTELIKEDYESPFSYTEWLKRTQNADMMTAGLTNDYNKYVKNWNIQKAKNKTSTTTREKYLQLIKNVALNYTTTEEQRFLTNLNYKNPRHVEAATSFVTRRLKKISQEYSDARNHIRQLSAPNITIGTPESLKQFVYGQLPRLVSSRETFKSKLRQNKLDLTKNKTVVSVIESYDIGTDETTSSDSIFQELPVTSEIFIDIATAIQELLLECLPVLEIADGLSFGVTDTIEVSEENISLLSNENFINYIKTNNNLNIRYQEEYIPRVASTSTYTLSGGTELKLFDPVYASRHVFDVNTRPLIRTGPSGNYRTKYQLGNMHVPQNMGVLTYYGVVNGYNQLNLPEGVQMRDPNRYGTRNVIDPVTDVTWIKADASNGNLAGDIINSKRLQKFYSYQSSDEIKYDNNTGISRPADPVGFFTGEKNNTWANSDVFEKSTSNVYEIDERQETLLTGDQRVIKWVTDVYGNEYALMKSTPALQPLEIEPGSQDEYVTNAVCQIIDGGDSLKPRSPLWSEGTQYKIFEGGRRWQYDSKIEQQPNYTPFEDLRQIVSVVTPDGTIDQRLEEHNTFDNLSTPTRDSLSIQPITYHGFVKKGFEPVYDEQAYCGLFTDLTCGQIDPSQRECRIQDNYAFGTFSDVLSTTDSGEQFYVSTSQPVTATQDAFELYLNAGYEHLDFTNTPTLSTTTVYTSENADGSTFADVSCLEEIGEFVYAEDTTSPYYNNELTVSRTQYSEVSESTVYDQTTYESMSMADGRLVFRSYNSAVVTEIHQVMDQLLTTNKRGWGVDHDIFREQVQQGRIVDIDMFYDVLVIQTADYVFAEKINFNQSTCKLEKSIYPGILVQTKAPGNKRDENLQLAIRPYYNKYNNNMIFGFTNSVELSGKSVVLPIIYQVDLNNMAAKIIKSTGDKNAQSEFTPTGTLSAFQYETVDRPVMSYNEIIDMYTLSYSCMLSGATQTCKGICVVDFENDNDTFELKSVELHHGAPVDRYTSNLQPWEEKTSSKLIRFNSDQLQHPTTQDYTYNFSFSSITGDVFKGYKLDLELETYTLPVPAGLFKINRILFDPDDGSETKIITRELTTGLEPLDFNIGDLPDQSDFADPRIQPVTHEYKFNDPTRQVYTPTLTAVYANYKKVIIQLTIEVEPYTMQSAFEDVKLIDTKTYTDPQGKNKQLLVLETQNPRYISHNTITKEIYSNSSVVGYLSGVQYSGDFHAMSDGTIMTGATHSPDSQMLTSSPYVRPVAMTTDSYTTSVDLQSNNYKYT